MRYIPYVIAIIGLISSVPAKREINHSLKQQEKTSGSLGITSTQEGLDQTRGGGYGILTDLDSALIQEEMDKEEDKVDPAATNHELAATQEQTEKQSGGHVALTDLDHGPSQEQTEKEKEGQRHVTVTELDSDLTTGVSNPKERLDEDIVQTLDVQQELIKVLQAEKAALKTYKSQEEVLRKLKAQKEALQRESLSLNAMSSENVSLSLDSKAVHLQLNSVDVGRKKGNKSHDRTEEALNGTTFAQTSSADQPEDYLMAVNGIADAKRPEKQTKQTVEEYPEQTQVDPSTYLTAVEEYREQNQVDPSTYLSTSSQSSRGDEQNSVLGLKLGELNSRLTEAEKKMALAHNRNVTAAHLAFWASVLLTLGFLVVYWSGFKQSSQRQTQPERRSIRSYRRQMPIVFKPPPAG